MQAGRRSLEEPSVSRCSGGLFLLGEQQRTAVQRLLSCLTFGRIYISFLLTLHFECQETPVLPLYPEVHVFVNRGSSWQGTQVIQGIHICPAKPQGDPDAGVAVLALALQHDQGNVECQGSRLITPCFYPKISTASISSSRARKLLPRTFKICGKTYWNLLACCFCKRKVAESLFFRVCHIFLWILNANVSEGSGASMFPS